MQIGDECIHNNTEACLHHAGPARCGPAHWGVVQEGLKPSTIIEVRRQESNLLDQICKMGQSTPEAKQMLDYHTPLKHFI